MKTYFATGIKNEKLCLYGLNYAESINHLIGDDYYVKRKYSYYKITRDYNGAFDQIQTCEELTKDYVASQITHARAAYNWVTKVDESSLPTMIKYIKKSSRLSYKIVKKYPEYYSILKEHIKDVKYMNKWCELYPDDKDYFIRTLKYSTEWWSWLLISPCDIDIIDNYIKKEWLYLHKENFYAGVDTDYEFFMWEKIYSKWFEDKFKKDMEKVEKECAKMLDNT